MSPAKKQVGAAHLSTADTTQRVTIDGHDLTMQLDDVRMLRSILDTAEAARNLDASSADASAVTQLVDLAVMMREAIDAALGEGTHAMLFGDGALPVMRPMNLIAALEEIAAPAYDRLLGDFAPKKA